MRRGQLTIFEGPDGSGKTTLAQRYAAQNDALYVHHGRYPELAGPELAQAYADSLMPALQGQPVVLDRSWLSERIYARALPRTERLTLGQYRSLERLAGSLGAQVFVTQPPASSDAWGAALAANAQLAEVQGLAVQERVRVAYDQLTELTSLPVRQVPWLPIQQRREACHVAREQPLLVSQTAAGFRRPGAVLVVGEAANVPDGEPSWPFGGFTNRGCSQWLNQQLAEAEVPEDRLLWVNALDADDDEMVEWLGYCKDVVCLGLQAANRCLALKGDGALLHMVPHPQWWKRFRHQTNPYPLIPLLKELTHGR